MCDNNLFHFLPDILLITLPEPYAISHIHCSLTHDICIVKLGYGMQLANFFSRLVTSAKYIDGKLS